MKTTHQATADVFVTALRALRKADRDAVLVQIARDKEFAQDVLDLALMTTRRKEPSRPFREYLAARKKR
ncbi:MAG: hypothetical protein FLDDKLPJ_00310 [Phycisphaerae bacterium]|nr:hypothetical protein [Phycisphaerae bacterium]